MRTQSYRRALLLICFVAVALRVVAVVYFSSWNAARAMEHAEIARNLLQGRGFSFTDLGGLEPTSVQSPTYPFLLAGLFYLFGMETPAAYVAALLVNCLLAVPGVVGMAAMTREMGGSRRASLIAAAMLGVWPTQVYAATHAQAVALITTCVVWMIALFIALGRERSARTCVAYSLVASLACLTEPTLLPITALTGAIILFSRGAPMRVRLRNGAILLGTGLLVLGPWTLRNWSVHGAFVPVKSSFWVNVWKGANDLATGTDRLEMPEGNRERFDESFYSLDDRRSESVDQAHQYDALSTEQRLELQGRTEIERDKIFRRYATTWIADHPGRFANLSLVRLKKSLWIDWDNPRSHSVVYLVSRATLVFLSVVGLLVALRSRWRIAFPLALFGSCLVVYTFTLTAARFAIPLEPVQFALGAAALGWITNRWAGERGLAE